MTPPRWPAVVLIPALIVGLVVVDRRGDDATPVPSIDTRPAMATVPSADALGSTWYCASGTSADGGAADHTLVISNPNGRVARGRLTIYRAALGDDGSGSTVDLAPLVVPLEVSAFSQLQKRVADIEGARADITAALVELDTGGILVERQVTGPNGLDRGACSSRSSPTWDFAAGSTRAGAHEVIVLFNPFPANAVVDMTFVTDEGIRSPQAFEGVVVPAGSVVPIDITDVVTLFEAVSTSASARTGRLVADRLQLFGAVGTAPDAAVLVGVDVVAGAPRPAREWVFAASSLGLVGDSADEVGVALVVYNPGEFEAEVDVDVRLDQPDLNGIVEPFELTIPAGQRVVVVLAGADLPLPAVGVVNGRDRIPEGVGFWVGVQSFNDLPVVAERVLARQGADNFAGFVGIDVSAGSSLVATRWTSSALGSDSVTEELVLLNAAPEGIARVSITSIRDGAAASIPALTDIEVPARQRIVVQVGAAIGDEPSILVVESTEPIAVERVASGIAPGVFTAGPAAPSLGTESAPGLLPFG